MSGTAPFVLRVVVCAAVIVVVAGRMAFPQVPSELWTDATATTIGDTVLWTNKVEIADLDGDGLYDLLFANGGNYSDPGEPEPNQVFMNAGPGKPFVEKTADVFGPTPDLARVIKARDLNGDGLTDIVVGTTYQTQSRLFLGIGHGAFREATASHLPAILLSVGDLEVGDVDHDGDFDLVLVDWGAGDNMSNAGGRTRLWLNDGQARFTDVTEERMPELLVRFSWDLELADMDNDFDLDIVVSCKRCPGSVLFENDGSGMFAETGRLPQYTNNYEFEPMDLDGDGLLDLVTINDGDLVYEGNRREHVFQNGGGLRFRDASTSWWPPESNIGEDDNVVAFLDFDSDGDADFIIGSLSGDDRLLINDGSGHLELAAHVFGGIATPGTLGIALADLDGDHRIDVVQGQGEHRTATGEKVYFGTGLAADTAPPSIAPVSLPLAGVGGRTVVRARVHDRKSPLLPGELTDVVVEWPGADEVSSAPMKWYGEYLWEAVLPEGVDAAAPYQVCATDRAGNRSCARPVVDDATVETP